MSSKSKGKQRLPIIDAPKRIKIVAIGAATVGKSCLIKRYCEERFVSKYIATIGIDYGVKPVNVDGIDVRVNFWDLSGHPEFFEVRNEFYKDAQGIVLAYDVTNPGTFEECDNWMAEATKYGANTSEVPMILCANKTDKKGRVVSEEEGQTYASNRGMKYFDVSAQSGMNVEEMFNDLFSDVVRRSYH
jgi:DnaJ family protein C protein 27